MISTHYLLSELDIGFKFSGGRPSSTFNIILNFFLSFFEFLCATEQLLNKTSALRRLVETYQVLMKEIFPNDLEIFSWFVALFVITKSSRKKLKL